MQVNTTYLTDNNVELKIVGDRELLNTIKDSAIKGLAYNIKVPGFREGKSPLSLAEKHLDQRRLQAEFLDQAINRLYIDAATQEKLRPVAQPEVKIIKFVPFDTLELSATVEVVGAIKLPDYTKLGVTKKDVKVSTKEVDDTIKQLLTRESDKTEVKRAGAKGDEVVIDFKGSDLKTKEPIKGASGTDYPLTLGSNTFIPGFEEHLVGLKANDTKTFDITFPKDYGLKSLQSRQVTFDVTIKKVNALKLAKLDDKLAAKVGPFKNVGELKADVKKQLETEKNYQAERLYENELVEKLAAATKMSVPNVLVEEQLKDIESEERRNLTYKGQTWEEYLKSEGWSEEEYLKQKRPEAELRVKIGLSLAEMAEKENVQVSRDELDEQLKQLKERYRDPGMQAELDKPEARQSIFNRLVTEKTLKLLVSYNQKA